MTPKGGKQIVYMMCTEDSLVHTVFTLDELLDLGSLSHRTIINLCKGSNFSKEANQKHFDEGIMTYISSGKN